MHHDHLVPAIGRQVLQQARDHLDRLAAGPCHPGDVAVRQLLDTLELVIPLGIIVVAVRS